MAKITASLKRIQISKANTAMFASIAIAAFLVVFALVSARALWIKRTYQGRIINEKEKAVEQVEANLQAIDGLVVSYKAFVSTSDNVIGGNPNGTGDKDGDNAKIVLDALPSKYDFPALTASLEKILSDKKYTINSITGTDEEIEQLEEDNSTPKPIAIPFEISATGNLKSIEELMSTLQRSIRPLDIQQIEVSGTNKELQVNIVGQTYYQPEKIFDIQKKVVK